MATVTWATRPHQAWLEKFYRDIQDSWRKEKRRLFIQVLFGLRVMAKPARKIYMQQNGGPYYPLKEGYEVECLFGPTVNHTRGEFSCQTMRS